MSLDTLIQWARHTLNFWWGCVEVSEACANCYARQLDKMRGPQFDNGNTHWGKTAPRWLRLSEAVRDAERMNRLAIKEGGERPRVFINSMADTFEDHPALPEARAVLFATIERLSACNWLLLTKRPENIMAMVPGHWTVKDCWPKHVWIGTTVENQKWFDIRVPLLLAVPAHVRFLSCEPLLGPLDMEMIPYIGRTFDTPEIVKERFHWVIVGGESGSHRKLDIAWVRNIRDQCQGAKVPVFIKQLGCQPFTFDKPEGVPSWPNQNMDVPPRIEHLWRLKDRRHGGDMTEWPADLRVREVPA